MWLLFFFLKAIGTEAELTVAVRISHVLRPVLMWLGVRSSVDSHSVWVVISSASSRSKTCFLYFDPNTEILDYF